MTTRVLLVAGEASGDLHAADLIREMRELVPDIEFRGIAGGWSREAGMETQVDVGDISTMGLTEVLEKGRAVWSAYRRLRDEIRSGRPSLLVLIDFPEFNLALARVARRHGIPVFYYISPQVWAWRRGRVRKILRRVDRLAVVFPFEPEVYRGSAKVSFVGHPLVDRVRTTASPEETRRRHGFDERLPLVTFFPGSREREIEALLPEMTEAARLLCADGPVQFAIGLARTIPRTLVEPYLADLDVPLRIVESDGYNLIGASTLVVASSGTVTLETALLETPLILMYRMSRTTYWTARMVVRVPSIGMPNLIAGRRIVPELVQNEVRAPRIAAEARKLLDDPARRAEMARDLASVREALGPGGAAARAARLAVDLIR